jgi:hypothetical protein
VGAPRESRSLNSPATDGGPSFFENDDAGNPLLYMTSSKAGGLGGIDIYVSALVGGLFQPPTSVSELNTAQFDLTPSIRHDGLEIIYLSRSGGPLPRLACHTARTISSSSSGA